MGCLFLKVSRSFAALWIPRRVFFTLPVTQTCLGRSMEQREVRFLIEPSWRAGDVLMSPGPVFILTFEVLLHRCQSSNLKRMYGLVGLLQRLLPHQASLQRLTFSAKSNTPSRCIFMLLDNPMYLFSVLTGCLIPIKNMWAEKTHECKRRTCKLCKNKNLQPVPASWRVEMGTRPPPLYTALTRWSLGLYVVNYL